MNNIRKGYVGIIEYKTMSDENRALHFSEWWNGEGLDFTITDKDGDDIKVSLHLDDLEAVVVASLLTGMIDLKECKKIAKDMKEQSKKREEYFKTQG